MPKDLRTYIADVHREVPDELVCIEREVNPANYDCTAIIKHLDALKKFPVVIFERPLSLHGEVSQTGADVDLSPLPCMGHHEMDGGPYVDMPSVLVDRHNGIYNLSYHRME